MPLDVRPVSRQNLLAGAVDLDLPGDLKAGPLKAKVQAEALDAGPPDSLVEGELGGAGVAHPDGDGLAGPVVGELQLVVRPFAVGEERQGGLVESEGVG